MIFVKRKRESIKPPAEDEWSAHKELLRGLYFNSTLAKLMEHMKEDFGFIASKNQYERKFKEWKFRKNLSSDEWEHVLRKKRKRDEASKETRVVLYGVEILSKRLKKEEGRYTLSDLNRIFSAHPNAPSPEGISVATPPAFVERFLRNIRTNNLPSLRLGNLFANWRSRQLSSQRDTLLQSHTVSFPPSPLSAPSMAARSIAELLGNPYSPSTVSTVESYETIVRQHRNATIEKYDGETEDRIAKLLGPSNTDALQEFMTFVAQFGSNNMLGGDQTTKILEWISQQSPRFLESLIELQDPAVQACLETLIKQSRWGHNKQAFTALMSADKNRHLYHGRRENLLCAAIELGWTDVVKDLVDEGIDVNSKVHRLNQNRYSLMYSVPSTLLGATSNVEIASILIHAGADLDAPIHDNIQEDDDDVLEYNSPVYYAAGCGNVDLVRLLTDFGASFDPSDAYSVLGRGESFLSRAIGNGDIEMVDILLGLGAKCSDSLRGFWDDDDDDDDDEGYYVGRTELQQASYMGETGIVNALLATSSGKHFMQTGQYRWTPLRDAAMQGHLDIVELLIAAGADVNATGQDAKESEDEVLKLRIQLIPSTALMAAVEAGYVEVIESLLRHGADVNAPAVGVYGTSVLAVAETLRSHDIASALREAGASSQRDVQHMIVDVQFAAARKDPLKVQEILALGVDVGHILDTSEIICEEAGGNLKDVLSTFIAVCGHRNINARGPVSHRCALELAIYLEDVTLIQELGKAGANFKGKTSHGLSLLQWALWNRADSIFEMIDCLLRYGESAESPRTFSGVLGWVETPLEMAAAKCDHRTLEHLLLSDTSQTKAASASTILPKAIRNKKVGLSLIQLLLDRGANANAFATDAPLQAAVSRQSIELVKLLLDRGANINAPAAAGWGKTALQAAVSLGLIEMVKLLLDRGANINAPAAAGWGETALQAAVSRQSIELVKLLLDRGANINAPAAARWGETPLLAAVSHGRIEMVKLLLDRGADINAVPTGVSGRTALQAAIRHYNPNFEITQLLIDNGADINAPAAMEYGVTALQAAAKMGSLNIALMLLKMGADPNAPGSQKKGRTALEGAADCGRLDMVQLLLNAGAKPTQCAADFAEKTWHFVIADMIKAALEEKEANDKGKGKEVQI
ncbi:ankyrin repeat-containing domain protein [Leptodontidium sp. MPI-SDFR-AT-0119]|nr:ankyrin repeat-containing domain protein [Leptodontidium sp. MPI-SDFR-AT-0119]